MQETFSFYEFFAGAGMARAGLGDEWQCLFANDVDALKAATYRENWGTDHFDDRDIRMLTITDLRGKADLAWASFPCQDLSVAGNGFGVGADGSSLTRSGALWPFLDLIKGLRQVSRQPPLVVLENVVGLLTLDGGQHFAIICSKLGELGYRYGAVVVDARHFVPQSRPRVFLVAVRSDVEVPNEVSRGMATKAWHPPPLVRAYGILDKGAQADWIWWDLGTTPVLQQNALTTVIGIESNEWNSPEATERFIQMMAPAHLARLEHAKAASSTQIGSLYHRMRREGAINRQRAEIAFGSTLGCLRTPRGGASRPRIIMVEKDTVKTRLLSKEEAAVLMGLSPTYKLPECYYHAFKIIGDGVVVPVVRFLSERLLEPLTIACRVDGRADRRWAA